MLKNEYVLAKIGVDRPENEPDVEACSNGITCTSYFEPRSCTAVKDSVDDMRGVAIPRVSRSISVPLSLSFSVGDRIRDVNM